MTSIKTTSALMPMHMLLKDICVDRPELTKPLEKDFQILTRMVETRGLTVLLEDLPSLGKALDKGLSSGWLVEPAGTGTFKNKTLRFYSLVIECFDTTGRLRDNVDPTTVLYIRQLCYMYKKLKVPCPPENVRKTVEEFVKLDKSLRPPGKVWEDPSSYTSQDARQVHFADLSSDDLFGTTCSKQLKLLTAFQRVCDIVVSTMEPITWDALQPRHGPGAVSDLKSGQSKYDFPNWPPKLGECFPREIFTSYAGDLKRHTRKSEPKSEEVIGLLNAVPKTFSKPRLITSEPTANQYCQQAILRYLRESFPNVLRRSVDFKDQGPSRDLTLMASKGGHVATVDLSNASDLLSCWTVERAIRTNPDLLRLMASSRTRYIGDATGAKAFQYLKLRKFAGQGAAVTFPIQTLIYTMIAVTAVLCEDYGVRRIAEGKITLRMIKRAAGKVRVYGDDIIVPVGYTLWYLERIISDLQLKINLGKSHFQGSFRESCGMDAFDGREVTPVYLSYLTPSDKADSIQSWVDVSNSFHRNGYWHLSTWMYGEIPQKFRRLIPISARADEYALALFTYSNGFDFKGKKRVCDALQTLTGEVLVVKSKEKRVQGCTDNNLLQYFLECVPCHPDNLGAPTFARWKHGHVVGNSSLFSKEWVVLH